MDTFLRMASIKRWKNLNENDKYHSEDGSNILHRNIGKHLPGYRMLQPRTSQYVPS
jgi:hypothetical protein